MLEVSPSIGTIAKPKLEIHPLGIGGKADPVRLVFSGKPAKDAVVVSMSDVRDASACSWTSSTSLSRRLPQGASVRPRRLGAEAEPEDRC